MRRVHVVGMGLAGLAAALDLVERPDLSVQLHEATSRAGGRVRSFEDRRLGTLVDNGNHLVLSGNRAVFDHARRIGTVDLLELAETAALPFVDLATGARWTLRLPDGPADLFAGTWAVPPGTGAGLARDLARLLAAGRAATVARALGRAPDHPAMRLLWEPLSLAVLNAPPGEGAAAALRAVLLRSALRGGRASRPVTMPSGLGPTLVDPARDLLQRRGAALRTGRRLTGLRGDPGRPAEALVFRGGEVPIAPGDAAILALPAEAAARILGGPGPGAGRPILNAHFRLPAEAASLSPPILGLTGGLAQWVFRRGDVLSVTVSAADAAAARPPGEVLAQLRGEVETALGAPLAPVAARLLTEHAATFAATPAAMAARLPMRTRWPNVVLAGDHVAGPLPATIEGALRSGRAAARAI
ncbi:hydroxysqualene dehydroxylase HpnE [Wenxinia saemankumensis]|uniref:Squalene-associated FAD-dependent desaturase n=1 Tax=Wenxinia saemankumensis TaxID=1447782 RepID=A0A1M6D0N5_9RHOB|nr:hydroxysqualene dehydroxylase HpnE [Wenxinia saemankumensis]SHI66827.1 squalene-associated FAD-dependent desaturase [Wenxinia saemankumensis]